MKKILVVEDDKFIARAYETKFKKVGYEIRLAYDGMEGLVALEEFKPDLILLDLVMPNKDGFQMLKEIRENPKWQKIPVLAVSNLGQKEDIEQAFRLGATDYIVKTDVALGDVVDKIESLFNETPH